MYMTYPIAKRRYPRIVEGASRGKERRSDRRTCPRFCERNFARESSSCGQSVTANIRNPMGQSKHVLHDVMKNGRTSLVQAIILDVTVSENVVAGMPRSAGNGFAPCDVRQGDFSRGIRTDSPDRETRPCVNPRAIVLGTALYCTVLKCERGWDALSARRRC